MIFEVRGDAIDTGKMIAYGARRTVAEAEQLLVETQRRVAAVGGRVTNWRVHEIDTTGLFELPPAPTPRERFTTRIAVTSPPNAWQTVHVDVLDRGTQIGSYDRNYAMLQTFEPFRQGDHFFALMAPEYTATSVMDLRTGEVVASEKPSPVGFCPVGFYVPDWWDVNDGSILPGSTLWNVDKEWPSRGDFGFVWGCVWGDDSSWKVQYLDLSRIQQGEIRREERFGYLKLATRPDVVGKEFIDVRSWDGKRQVEFAVLEVHDLDSGKLIEDSSGREPNAEG
jgi:hypothetical protein